MPDPRLLPPRRRRRLGVLPVVLSFAFVAGVSGVRAQDPSCIRRDTFERLPLTSAAEVAAYIAVRHALRPLRIRPSNAERARLYWFCDSLGLREQRVGQALKLLDLYIYRDGGQAELLALAEDVANNLDVFVGEELSQAYNALGNVRSTVNDHARAIEYYLLSYETAAPDHIRDRVYALGNLGVAYVHIGDTTRARQALQRSYRLSTGLESADELAYNRAYDCASIARLLVGHAHVDSARHYLAESRQHVSHYPRGTPRHDELLEEYTRAAVPHLIRWGEYRAARRHLDTLATLSPDRASLLAARLARAEGRPRAALDTLIARSYGDGRLERDRVDLLIALAAELGEGATALEQLRVRLADSERETQQMREALTSVSASMVRSFDAQRAAASRAHAEELGAYRARQRLYVAALAILGSLAVATFFFLRYRRYSRRAGRLSALVTEQERDLEVANAALRERVAALERHHHLLSHDLREPVRSISGFAQLLGRDLRRAGLAPANFDFLSGGIRQLEDLLEAVESLRRTEDHRAVARRVDVRKLVERCAAVVRDDYPDAAIVIEFSPDLTAVTDPKLLTAIATALLDNACKFSARGADAAVAIRAHSGAGTLSLEVADAGIGIAPTFRTQVFEPFKRLNRREDFPGAGIGLAVVAAAVRKLGGTVSVEAGVGGRGTRFRVRIPVREGSARVQPSLVVEGTGV